MAKRRRMVDTSRAEDEEDAYPSRGDRRTTRREAQDRLETIGKRMTLLGERTLERLALELDLSPELEREVGLLGRLAKGSALPRQRRRVAALLRDLDLDVVESRLDEISGTGLAVQIQSDRLERWRRELLAPGSDALTRLCESYPAVDRTRLSQAIRAAQGELSNGPPGRRYKELFQVLRELGLGRPAPTSADAPSESNDD